MSSSSPSYTPRYSKACLIPPLWPYDQAFLFHKLVLLVASQPLRPKPSSSSFRGNAQRSPIAPLTIMAFSTLSLLFLKFRGRSAAMFRNRYIHYELSRLYILRPSRSPRCQSNRAAGTGHRSSRTAQLPTPAGRSYRGCRFPSGDPRPPRSSSGRAVEENLVDRQCYCTHRDDCTRIWCIPCCFLPTMRPKQPLTMTFLLLMLPQNAPQTSPAYLSYLIIRNHALGLAL